MVYISAVTEEKVTRLGKKLFSKLRMQWLFYGNLLPNETLKIVESYETSLTNKFSTKPFLSTLADPTRTVNIPEGIS